MSTDGRVTSKRIKLAVVVGVPLLFAVACSSNGVTCAEGNRSNACLVSDGHRADQITGSIQPQRAASRKTAAPAPARIARPMTVQRSAQLGQPNTVIPRRQMALRKLARKAHNHRLATCDVTGSIPRYKPYPAAVVSLSAPSGAIRQTARPIEHFVAPGETLYTIAHRYGASVVEIASFNVIENTARIKSGNTILIPPS